MARYSTVEALQSILQEETNTDEENEIDSDENNSEDGDFIPSGNTDQEIEDNANLLEDSDDQEYVTTTDKKSDEDQLKTKGKIKKKPDLHSNSDRKTSKNSLSNETVTSAVNSKFFVDRSGRQWNAKPPAIHRRQSQDIIRQQIGVTLLCSFCEPNKCSV